MVGFEYRLFFLSVYLIIFGDVESCETGLFSFAFIPIKLMLTNEGGMVHSLEGSTNLSGFPFYLFRFTVTASFLPAITSPLADEDTTP